MRSILLSFLAFCALVTSSALAQIEPCSELFISEYVEGTGNNKCLEFFNPTEETMDLTNYELQRWSNGEGAPTDVTQLIGTLPPLTTWVLVNGQTEDTDLGGGNISPACDPDLQQLADQLDNPYPAPTYMNGNDALVLVKNGTSPVDIFGKPGEDPGVAWTDDEENGYVDVEGAFSAWLTSNHTLRRKSSVNHGVSVPPLVFNTFLEWDTLPVNTWDGLGSHSCDCGSTEISEVFEAPEANIYPNPTSTGEFTIETFSDVETIEVFSPSGKIVASIEPNTVLRRWSFNAVKWDAGIYFVNIKYSQGTIFSHRVVIR